MISKLKLGALLTVVALFVATPTSVIAASSSDTKAKIKKFSAQLKKLPNGGASASAVSKLVLNLSKLDAKNASKYYKIGLTKLANTGGTASAAATKLAGQVKKIVTKSGLSSGQINKINKTVDKTDGSYVPPPDPNNPPS